MLVYLLSITNDDKKQDVTDLFMNYHKQMLDIAATELKRKKDANYIVDAQDAVQSAYVKLTKYINTVNKVSKDNMTVYLYSVVKNEVRMILDVLEKNRAEPIYGDVVDTESDFVKKLLIRERYDEVVDAIKKLDENYSTVLLHRYVFRHSTKQIAEMLGISREAVYSRMQRAKRALLEMLSASEE